MVVGVEQQLKDYFSRDSRGLVAAYLFGSHGRGEAGPRSDVDVGLVWPRGTAITLDRLGFDMAADVARLAGCEVDMVVLNDAHPSLVHRVLRDGRLVLDADPAARIAFEVSARNRYFDMKPILNEYRRAADEEP